MKKSRSANEIIQDCVEALNKFLAIEGMKDALLLDPAQIIEFRTKQYKDECLRRGRPLRGRVFEYAIEGVKISTKTEEIPNLILVQEIVKNVYPLFKKGKIIEALNSYNAEKNIFHLLVDKGSVTSNNNMNEILFGLLGPLISALPVMKENDDRIKQCEQCSQFMLKRGEIKRFCSEACRNNAHEAATEFDPGRKEYHRLYSKMIKVNEQSHEEFQKEYKNFIESQKEKINHGKKTKSK